MATKTSKATKQAKANKAATKKAAPKAKATPKLDAATQAEVAKVAGPQAKKADKPLDPTTKALKDTVEPDAPKAGTVFRRTVQGTEYECHVTEGGFEVRQGKKVIGSYRSLSGAAAGVAELHQMGTAINGKVWWGHKSAPSNVDPMERFASLAERIVAVAATVKTDPKGLKAIHDLSAALGAMTHAKA